MRAAFLESDFQTPALHEVPHDLRSWLLLVGGKQRFGWSLSCWVAREDPPNRQRSRAEPIPPGKSGTQFQGSLPFPIPIQSELLPDGVGILEHCQQGGKAW